MREFFGGPRGQALSAQLFQLAGPVGTLGMALLLVLGAMVRLELAPVALSEWDSWGWLSPAVNWIGGLGFREEYEREWLYGAFLAGGLRLTGSFAGLIVIQQALGLGAAALMWLTWRRWLALFPRHLLLEWAGAALGLGIIALFLFNPFSLVLELSIRPEAIMAFVAVFQLFFVTAFCQYRWQTPDAKRSLIYGALVLPLAWAMYVLKPNWALAVPLTTFPLLLGLIGGPFSWKTRAVPLAAGAVLLIVCLWLPDKLFFHRTTQTRVVLPMTLLTIHADIIRESLADELASPNLPEPRRKFLSAFLPEFDREMANARAEESPYRRLGFDPDYLMYRARLFPILQEQHGMTMPDIAAFCRSSFLNALWRQPTAYAQKVARQMDYFLRPDDPTFSRKSVDLARLHRYSLTTLPAELDVRLNPATREMFQTYRTASAEQGHAAGKVEAVRSFRDFLKTAKHFAPWLMGLFLVSLAALAWPPLAPLRVPGLVAFVYLGAPFGNALTVAMVHALDNDRYRGSYGPLFLFALAAGLFFSLATLTRAGKTLLPKLPR